MLRREKKAYEPLAISDGSNSSINVFFIIYSIICIAPVVLIIATSLTQEESIMIHGYSFIPKKFDLAAYRYLLADFKSIARGYGISLFVTIVGTAASVLITTLYAYPVSRPNMPGHKFFSFFIFFTMLFNGGLVATYMINVQVFDFKNRLIALIIPLLLNPFNVLIVRTFLKNNIPDSLLEAAKIDGASEFRIFWQLVIPLSKPVIATITLFNLLGYWNDWFQNLLYITDQSLYNLQYIMYSALMNVQFLSQYSDVGNLDVGIVPTQGMRFAMVVIAIGPVIFAYPKLQKHFVKGLTIGSIKG